MSTHSTAVPIRTKEGGRLSLNIAPQPPVTRAREPVRPTAGKVVGFFPSVKNNRQIAWESQLEKWACLLFEFSHGVMSYREQPRTIFYPSRQGLRKYTPDFEITLRNKQVVYVEVKPAEKLNDELLKEKLRDIDAFFKKHDHHFIVITDLELNQPIRQENLTFLRPYLKNLCRADLVGQSISWLSKNKVTTLNELCVFTGSLNLAYALIAQFHIAIDLDKKISPDTQIFLPKETSNENCLFAYRTAPQFERRAVHCESNP